MCFMPCHKGGHCIAHNVLQLGEEADLEALTFSLAQMPVGIANIQFSTKPAFLPNTCYKK